MRKQKHKHGFLPPFYVPMPTLALRHYIVDEGITGSLIVKLRTVASEPVTLANMCTLPVYFKWTLSSVKYIFD